MNNLDLSVDGAVFSEDRIYRYALWRKLNESPKTLLIIGLNPSTADESTNDPTIRRCIGFAKTWGYGSLIVSNLFAFRATKPNDLVKAMDPVGKSCDLWLDKLHKSSDLTLAAWGVHGSFLTRGDQIYSRLQNLKCLGVTKDGFPRHPLYVKATQNPIDYIGITSKTKKTATS